MSTLVSTVSDPIAMISRVDVERVNVVAACMFNSSEPSKLCRFPSQFLNGIDSDVWNTKRCNSGSLIRIAKSNDFLLSIAVIPN